LKKTQRNEPALAVGKAVVFECERQALKYCLGIDEVQSVVPKVGLALLLVPAVSHLRSVYTPETEGKPVHCSANARVQRPPANALKCALYRSRSACNEMLGDHAPASLIMNRQAISEATLRTKE